MEKEALLYQSLDGGVVQCRLCAHRCRITEGESGFCGVRYNRDGILFTRAYGNPVARHVDPVEKKPLYHFLPGSRCYSIATAGCNFRCGFCQNWRISQAAPADDGRSLFLSPERVAAEAKQSGAAAIAFTYTEPTIFYEYARDIALEVKKNGLKTVFVTNGYMSRQLLEDAAVWLDAANVDLKSWSDDYYRENCAGHLQPVLKTIAYLKQLCVWVEVTTLIIPGENDSDEELAGIAGFIAATGKDIPWHISRFHPDYRFDGHSATPLETMERARRFGYEAGLQYVYLGNIAGENDTDCPACGKTVVHRSMSGIRSVELDKGRCRYCGRAVHGRWE